MQRNEGFVRWRRILTPLRLFSVYLMLLFWCVDAVQAAGALECDGQSGAGVLETADVVVDGRVVLKVRGLSAYPAARRAAEIREQIIAVAGDESIRSGAVVVKDRGDHIQLVVGNRMLVDLFDADAAMDGVTLKILAENEQVLLQEAVATYRHDRSPRVLLIKTLYPIFLS